MMTPTPTNVNALIMMTPDLEMNDEEMMHRLSVAWMVMGLITSLHFEATEVELLRRCVYIVEDWEVVELRKL